MRSSGASMATSGTTTTQRSFLSVASEPVRDVSENPAIDSASMHSAPDTATRGITLWSKASPIPQARDCELSGASAGSLVVPDVPRVTFCYTPVPQSRIVATAGVRTRGHIMGEEV